MLNNIFLDNFLSFFQRMVAVAHFVLYAFAKLAKGLFKLRNDEQWIITKPVPTLQCKTD